jgi:hypothetical protein
MRTLAILGFLSLSLWSAGSAPAAAAAWCARYAYGEGTNCGFATYEQCEADISGMSDAYCAQNPAAPQTRRPNLRGFSN